MLQIILPLVIFFFNGEVTRQIRIFFIGIWTKGILAPQISRCIITLSPVIVYIQSNSALCALPSHMFFLKRLPRVFAN